MNNKYYGIVEGFFSKPFPLWTARQRNETILFLSQYTPYINTYLYCPKDDPYVTQSWATLYPENILQELRNTVELCATNNITFFYGLNPAFDFDMTQNNFDEYIITITQKLNQLKTIGVNEFCLLFDDVPYAYNVTEDVQDTRDAQIGMLQARVMNTMYDYLKKNNGKLWFCPSDYFFMKKTPYITAIKTKLNDDIPLFWTGDRIFTKTITPSMINTAKEVMGKNKKIIWWNNYPVNDCEHTSEALHIGGFNNPSPQVTEQLDGIMINPMRQVYVNMPYYDTFATYVKNPLSYQRDVAYQNAYKKIWGTNYRYPYRIDISFSSKNIVDDTPRGYMAQILEATDISRIQKIIARIRRDIISTKPTSSLSKLISKERKPLIDAARSFCILAQKIINGESCKSTVKTWDMFPVVLKKTYLTKLMRVTLVRLVYTNALQRNPSTYITKLYNSYEDNCIPDIPPPAVTSSPIEKNMYRLLQLYVTYYKKSKLLITKTDERLLFTLLDTIQREDQALFIQTLKNRDSLQKIKMVVMRNSINGY